jgi:hypothetical protein
MQVRNSRFRETYNLIGLVMSVSFLTSCLASTPKRNTEVNSVAERPTRQAKPISLESTLFEEEVTPKSAISKPDTQKTQQNSVDEEPIDSSSTLALTAEDKNFSPRCVESFYDSTNENSLSQVVTDSLSDGNHYELLENPKPWKNLCPNYSGLSKDKRKDIVAFLMMGLANFESGCDPNAENKKRTIVRKTKSGKKVVKHVGPPNGTAKGILQLHLNHEGDYNDPLNNCADGVSRNASRSLKCGLSMLEDQVRKYGKIFFSESHWQVLRPSGRSSADIQEAISDIPDCSISMTRSYAGRSPSKSQFGFDSTQYRSYITRSGSGKRSVASEFGHK